MDDILKKTLIFKKFPANEEGSEIALLKDYFDSGLIDDPKDMTDADDSKGSKSYPVKAHYDGTDLIYKIKAYKTQGYSKDRRLIISSTDKIASDRKSGYYLCIAFDGDKITRNSKIQLFVIPDNHEYYSEIKSKYGDNGLVLNSTDDQEIFDSIMSRPLIEENNKKTNMQPLNQILYGPPGTGKTYSTVTRALNILGMLEWKEKYTDEEYSEAQEMFKQELGNRIEFVTMHQSFSYEDFVQGLKPGKGKTGIEFSYENGVFKEICERARGFEEYGKHSFFSSYIMSVYEEDVKDLFPDHVKSQDDRLKFLVKKIDNSKGQILVKGPRDVFDRILGDKTPREGWTKENFKNKEVWDTCERTYKYFESIPKEVCISLFKKYWIEPKHIKIDDKDLKEMSLRNYVIILDEINRANVSKVFGELITLIEDDKREMISTTLPSGEQFTVPKNLYIIGTMNTADRSVSNIDIALRRRFEFIPLYPNKDLVTDPAKQKFMEDINIAITEVGRKSIDFRIGHADFMKSLSLIDTINRKTIPLLMEYFRNNGDIVLEIVQKALPSGSGIVIEKNAFDIPEVSKA
jgi:5-methylcytosine-specific restriction protein B